ncbi:MAG: alpha/beta hydrolase [Actinomycetota bacterium]|nr:alpha/beta hydrolase [Actinomycetota bacterium]
MPTADLGDISISYSEHGSGPPVVGIMGFSLDKRFWGPQIPTVTETNRFIIFDNRGIGRSTGGPPASIDQMADDTIRLLDHLGIDEAIVFGVSMGGAIAQRLTLDHRDRVKALILAVTFARSTEFMQRQHVITRTLLEVEGWTRRQFVEIAMLRMFTPRFYEAGTDVIDQILRAVALVEEREEWRPEVLVAQLDAIDKQHVLDELPRITCPTLVIAGRLDMTVPAFASEEIAGAIPGAEFHMLETGHGCMIEEMDTFNALVSDFLRRQNAS